MMTTGWMFEKAKIDADGFLEVQRGSVLRKQCCPRTLNTNCCDKCPLFGEPIDASSGTNLQLCEGIVIRVVSFTDERV